MRPAVIFAVKCVIACCAESMILGATALVAVGGPMLLGRLGRDVKTISPAEALDMLRTKDARLVDIRSDVSCSNAMSRLGL